MEKLSDNQLAFARFIATPDKVRGTQKEFAHQIGVDPVTLTHWRKLPGFDIAVEEARANILIPQAIDVLQKMLISPSDNVKLEAAQSILKKWVPHMGEHNVPHSIKEIYEKYHPKETGG